MKKLLLFISALLSFSAGAQNQRNTDSIVMVDFQFLQSVEISTGYHFAFPDICKTSDDSLLIVYRTGTTHSGIDGQIVRQKGSMDGINWTPAVTAINDGFTDDRDPSVFLLPNGNLMSIYYKWLPGNLFANPAIPPMHKLFYSISNDNGLTFSAPVELDTTIMQLPAGYTYSNYTYYDAMGNVIKNFAGTSHAVNAYGRLMFPSYGGSLLAATTNYQPFCFASEKFRLYMHESYDNGLTWTYRIINEFTYPNVWLTEPSICDLGNGKMIMHIRTSVDTCEPSSLGQMLQSYSYDGGDTWTTPQPLQIYGGQAPYLYKTSKGVLISAFRLIPNFQFSNQSTALIYSYDEGLTWSQPITIETCWAECGYPSIIEIDTNIVMVVYYTALGTGIKGVIYKLNIVYFDPTLSVNADFEDKKISIYPNPSQGEISMEYSFVREKEINLNIYNAMGAVVYKDYHLAYAGEHKKNYNFSDLPSGIYYMSIENQGKEIRKKLVISR